MKRTYTECMKIKLQNLYESRRVSLLISTLVLVQFPSQNFPIVSSQTRQNLCGSEVRENSAAFRKEKKKKKESVVQAIASERNQLLQVK